jgi:hypothetical protein
LQKRYGYRGALGDDRKEVASRNGKKEDVCFAKSGVASGLVIEERFVAEIITSVELTYTPFLLVENLHDSFSDEVNPVSDLTGGEDFFIFFIIVFVELFRNGEEDF